MEEALSAAGGISAGDAGVEGVGTGCFEEFLEGGGEFCSGVGGRVESNDISIGMRKGAATAGGAGVAEVGDGLLAAELKINGGGLVRRVVGSDRGLFGGVEAEGGLRKTLDVLDEGLEWRPVGLEGMVTGDEDGMTADVGAATQKAGEFFGRDFDGVALDKVGGFGMGEGLGWHGLLPWMSLKELSITWAGGFVNGYASPQTQCRGLVPRGYENQEAALVGGQAAGVYVYIQ